MLWWCKCLTLVVSSRNNGEAPIRRSSFTLTFCSASNALWGVLSHMLRKMIENLSGCIEWAEVSFRETVVWEVLVFPQVFRGFPPSLSAVNQHHRTADGRLCLAGAHILGAYCCPQRWGCQGRMPSKSAGEHYISHYLRTIGHFLLAAGQRGWSGAAKLQEGSRDCRRLWRLKGGNCTKLINC